MLWQTKHWAIHRNFNCISSSIHLLLGASFHCTSHLLFYHFVISFTLDHYSVASFLSYFTFHSISFYQARKLYRSMVLEKKRNEAAIVIAAYCRGWKVIELWPPSTVCRTIQFHSVTISFLSTSQLWFYHFIISFTLDHYSVASFFLSYFTFIPFDFISSGPQTLQIHAYWKGAKRGRHCTSSLL